MVGHEEYYTQGYAARQAGNLEDARVLFQAQLQIAPNHCGALNALADIELTHGHSEMAMALCRRVLAVNDQPGNHWGMLGACHAQKYEFPEAIKVFRAGIERQPDHPKLWHNLGISLYQENRAEDSVIAFEGARDLAPRDADVHSDLGMAYLATGDLARGLESFEARWAKLTRQLVWNLGVPEWQGEDLRGKSIIHHHEQGFGDTFQFIRFARNLSALGAKVAVAVPPSMVALAKTVPGVHTVIPYDKLFPGDFPDKKLRAYDYHTPMTSTPRHLGVTYANMRSGPYIRARHATKIAGPIGTRLRVGIVWGGSPALAPDKERSAPVEAFLPLTEIDGVRLYSLQKGRVGEMQKAGADAVIVDLDGRMTDWAETANLMMRMDLVVSVDTAPLHLAGALGVPVIGLMQYARCWRWLRGREDTPWYPSMRLITQTRRFDWSGPMQSVRSHIEDMLA
jgi:tetratricopeptide (TPR) repeat protein